MAGVQRDRIRRPSKASEALAPKLLAHLNEPINFDAYLFNLLLLERWQAALNDRSRSASMLWWKDRLNDAETITVADVQSILIDDLEGLKADYDKAETYHDLELKHWPEDEHMD